MGKNCVVSTQNISVVQKGHFLLSKLPCMFENTSCVVYFFLEQQIYKNVFIYGGKWYFSDVEITDFWKTMSEITLTTTIMEKGLPKGPE